MAKITTSSQNVALSRAGKYLTFQLAGEVYGIEILRVQEIIGMMKITSVPRTPPEVRGVINLRGQVIAVIDLRLKFDMPAGQDTERTCITVVQIGGASGKVTVGLVVDNVCEVLDIEEGQIEPAPSFGRHVNTDFILGMAKINENVITMLDIEKVLDGGELEGLSGLIEEEAAAS